MPLVGASSITVMSRGCFRCIVWVYRRGFIALEDERETSLVFIC
jgi:hypothetical protein